MGRNIGHVRSAKTGNWMLDTEDRVPENIDGQALHLLGKLSDDLSIWKVIHDKYKVDLFCGLFMTGTNEGLTISAATLELLGVRGINRKGQSQNDFFECD